LGQRQDAVICTVQVPGLLGLGQGMADQGKADGFHRGSLAAGRGPWFSMLRGFWLQQCRRPHKRVSLGGAFSS